MRFLLRGLFVFALGVVVILPSPPALRAAGDAKALPAIRADMLGDPLPAGAIARMGTIRFLHQDWIRHLAFMPDDKQLLAACSRVVSLWDSESGRELKRFPELNSVMCAALSPDGTTVAVAENGNRIFLVDTATGKTQRQLAGDKDRSVSVAWSGDGRTLAAGFEKITYVWEAASGKLLHRLQGETEFAWAVALAPDGKSLVSGDGNGLQLWDLTTGQKMAKLEGRTDSAFGCLKYAPDGKTLVGPCNEPIGKGSSRSSLRQWDAVTGKKIRDLTGGSFNCVAFTADGQLLASGDGQNVRLWDLVSGKELRRWSAHVDHVTALAFSHDGKTLASGGRDSRVRLWDPATGKARWPAHGHHGQVSALAFAPDGQVVASGGPDCTIRFWDPITGRELRRCNDVGPPMLASHFGVFDLSYARDGKTLVSGERHTAKTEFRLWEAATARPLSHFSAEHVSALACAPDNESVLAATWEGGIAAWELTRGKLLHRAGKHTSRLKALSLSPDGRTVAWVGEYGDSGMRDLKTGQDVFHISHKVAMQISRVSFSPDGTVVATAGISVRLWDGTSGMLLAEWNDMRSSDVAFSPDGRLIAAATGREIALWDIAARQEVLRWRGDPGNVTRLAFAPNGLVLVSASEDGTLLTWDVTGQLNAGKLPRIVLKDAEVNAHWQALRGADAAAAHRAIWALAAAAPASLALVEKQLRPVPAAAEINRLVTDLDSEVFDIREKALRDLSEIGDGAEPALRRALELKSSLELRRRTETLRKALDEPAAVAKRLHAQRTIAVLEYAGSSEARQLLERLAAGAPQARLSQQARAALARLSKAG